jgi:hypothetical protein
VRPLGLVDGISVTLRGVFRAIGDAEARGLGTAVALAPEWGADHVIP